MKIRTQLILSLLALAVLPLTAIVLFSYVTSLQAVRAAEEAEATEMAARLETRLAETQEEFGRRIRELDGVDINARESFGRMVQTGVARPLAKRLLSSLGDVAPLISHIEFVPENVPTAPTAPSEVMVMTTIGESGQVISEMTMEPMVIDVREILEEMVVVEQNFEEAHEGLPEAELAIETARMSMRLLNKGLQQIQALGGDGVVESGGSPESEGSDESEDAGTYYEFGFGLDDELNETVEDRQIFAKEGWVVPVMGGESRVGGLRLDVDKDQLAQAVLSHGLEEREGDIAFAVDSEGEFLTADATELAVLKSFAEPLENSADPMRKIYDDYVVATTVPDPETGLRFGVARPLGEAMAGVRSTAVRNLASGLVLILIALFGVLPLARRMTRNLDAVIAGVERVAQGDLNVRIAIHSKNEFGQLAQAVNTMAVELLDQEVRLVEQERQSREQEVRERVLQSEYQRKSLELEDARRFQLSMLPKQLPDHARYEVAVAMQTAAEVGGDYYDFRADENGDLTVAIGDATGHGAKAGTMVTIIKSLFSAHTTDGPGDFLAAAGEAIRRMDLGRMLMALTLGRFSDGRLTLSAAGMPPVLRFTSSTASVEELELSGMPLGGMAWDYGERTVEVSSGDTFLFLSDGFPEAVDASGTPYGYERVAEVFCKAAQRIPREIIKDLLESAESWRGEMELADDLTLVVVRVR